MVGLLSWLVGGFVVELMETWVGGELKKCGWVDGLVGVGEIGR